MKIYLVYKLSFEEILNKRGIIRQSPSIADSHKQHYQSLETIISILKKKKLKPILENRKRIRTLPNLDLVITVGGDGTVLRAARYLKQQPILAVNSAPNHSVGALCSTTADDFEKQLDQFLNGKAKFQKIPRLAVSKNGKKQNILALNEFLYANSSPAGMSRYSLKIGKKAESQKSSGIWIATAAGSTGAISACGGKKLSASTRKAQWIVREPYIHSQWFKGNQINNLTIINHTLDALLYADGGVTTLPLQFGDALTFEWGEDLVKV